MTTPDIELRRIVHPYCDSSCEHEPSTPIVGHGVLAGPAAPLPSRLDRPVLAGPAAYRPAELPQPVSDAARRVKRLDWRSAAYWRALRVPERVEVPYPAPVITPAETYAQGWSWWPQPAVLIQRHAEKNGWQHRTGFSRGYVPGLAKDSYVMIDQIGVWLDGHGYRAGVFWERRPESDAKTGNDWKASGGLINSGRMPVLVNHTLIRRFIATRELTA